MPSPGRCLRLGCPVSVGSFNEPNREPDSSPHCTQTLRGNACICGGTLHFLKQLLPAPLRQNVTSGDICNDHLIAPGRRFPVFACRFGAVFMRSRLELLRGKASAGIFGIYAFLRSGRGERARNGR